jgi:hypothetical protein
VQKVFVEHSSSLDEVADFLNAQIRIGDRIVDFQIVTSPNIDGAYHAIVLLETDSGENASPGVERIKPSRNILDILRFGRRNEEGLT